jgi:hypothetical protein
MKKILLLLTMITVLSCNPEEPFGPIEPNEIPTPESLIINDVMGIKLESSIVVDEVRMNVKLPHNGTYRIKIKDITGKVISQEKITSSMGDNILSVYTSVLPKSSYTIELYDNNNKLGGAVFSMDN